MASLITFPSSFLRVIGDCHGKFQRYENIISTCDKSIQVGDFGIGFPGSKSPNIAAFSPSLTQHRFIRGNHDNPSVCQKHPWYLGDFGFIPEYKICFISGAYSIDQQFRTPGLDWWPDEELKFHRKWIQKEIEKYYLQAEIIITHDCPDSISNILFPYKLKIKSNTSDFFDHLWNLKRDIKPKYWIFGHWHDSKNVFIEGTNFICLTELEYFDLKI